MRGNIFILLVSVYDRRDVPMISLFDKIHNPPPPRSRYLSATRKKSIPGENLYGLHVA